MLPLGLDDAICTYGLLINKVGQNLVSIKMDANTEEVIKKGTNPIIKLEW